MVQRATARGLPNQVLDLEARARPGDHDALRAWLRILATSNLIKAHLRRRLAEEFGTTLPRFDLMAQLYREPRGLKMSAISQRMMVTGGNVTGVAAPLESLGLIERTSDPQDGRASFLSLTDKGRSLFRAMAAKHELWIVETFADVTRSEMSTLTGVLGKVKTRARKLEATSR